MVDFTATPLVSGPPRLPAKPAFLILATSNVIVSNSTISTADTTPSGATDIQGALAVTGAPDVAQFIGSSRTPGTLSAVESASTASFTGTVALTSRSGTLAVTEVSDSATVGGTVVPLTAISGTLAVTGASDIARFTSAVQILQAIETSDGALFSVAVVTPVTVRRVLRLDDLSEATAILHRVTDNMLLLVTDKSGRPGSQFRMAIGDIQAQGQLAFGKSNTLAADLLNCFKLAEAAGASFAGMDELRQSIEAETPQSVKATAITQLALRYSLSSLARLTLAIDFVSRDEVDRMLKNINVAFEVAQDIAANDHDAASYQAIIGLHAALSRNLTEVARPLPRVVTYEFLFPAPTLWMANRLYADASRADEIVRENNIVHPAFAPPQGHGLSA